MADGTLRAVNQTMFRLSAPVPFASMLEAALGLPVRLLNDGAAAAWGEYRFGAGRGARSLVFVTISTGVGGGIVLHGRPLSGRQGLAGHVGFLTADPDGPPCGSGRRGTLEFVASGAALARQATELFGRPLDAPALFTLHGRDPRADAILDAAAAATARAFADLAALLDPDRIVVGGGVGLAPGYLELVAAHLAAEPELFPPAARPRRAGCGRGAGGRRELDGKGHDPREHYRGTPQPWRRSYLYDGREAPGKSRGRRQPFRPRHRARPRARDRGAGGHGRRPAGRPVRAGLGDVADRPRVLDLPRLRAGDHAPARPPLGRGRDRRPLAGAGRPRSGASTARSASIT